MILMWASSSEAEAEAEAVAAGLISRQHGEMRGLMHISTDLARSSNGTESDVSRVAPKIPYLNYFSTPVLGYCKTSFRD